MAISVHIFGSPEAKKADFLELFSDPSFRVTFLQLSDPWKISLNHSRDNYPNDPLLLIKGNSFSGASSDLISQVVQLKKYKLIFLGWAGTQPLTNPTDLGLSRLYTTEGIKKWQAVLLSPELVSDLRQIPNLNLDDYFSKHSAQVVYPSIFVPDFIPIQRSRKTSYWWIWLILLGIILILICRFKKSSKI